MPLFGLTSNRPCDGDALMVTVRDDENERPPGSSQVSVIVRAEPADRDRKLGLVARNAEKLGARTLLYESRFCTPSASITVSSSTPHCKLPVMFAGIATVALSCSTLDGFMIGDGPRFDSIEITAEMAGSTTTVTVFRDSRVLPASVTTTVTELVVLCDNAAAGA